MPFAVTKPSRWGDGSDQDGSLPRAVTDNRHNMPRAIAARRFITKSSEGLHHGEARGAWLDVLERERRRVAQAALEQPAPVRDVVEEQVDLPRVQPGARMKISSRIGGIDLPLGRPACGGEGAYALSHVAHESSDEASSAAPQGKVLLRGEVTRESAAIREAITGNADDRAVGRHVFGQDRVGPGYPTRKMQPRERPQLGLQLQALTLGPASVDGVAGGSLRIDQVELDVLPVDVVGRGVDRQPAIQKIAFQTDLVVACLVRIILRRHDAAGGLVRAAGAVPGRQPRVEHEIGGQLERWRHEISEGAAARVALRENVG